MPSSIRRILIHGADMIESIPLPMEDMVNTLLIFPDPFLTSLCQNGVYKSSKALFYMLAQNLILDFHEDSENSDWDKENEVKINAILSNRTF